MHSLKTLVFILVIYSWGEYAVSSDSSECISGRQSNTIQELVGMPLPVRNGPRIKTSGRVPHVQLDFSPNSELNDKLFQLALTLPGLSQRPTIVSLPGATGMWLADDVPVVHPKAIVAGREFAHIHRDGSLHIPLPLKRALEMESRGWGERHPWADKNDGWEGLVMLFSASTDDEMEIVLQLITESYNHVTGRAVRPPIC